MQRSETAPLWWDRVDDESGRPLRGDVRESARKVWPSVCAQARRILGDVADAAELLESAIRKISIYLDKNEVPLHAADPAGLLLLATYRALKRLARHRGQGTSADQESALAEVLRAPDWREEVDRRLFLERLGHELDDKTRAILRLRLSGAGWNEIARVLQIQTAAAKRSFWRNIRRAYLRLLCPPEPTARATQGYRR
jgi:hypothetical protein